MPRKKKKTTNKFSKLAGYKIIAQESGCISILKSKKKIKKIILFTIATKRITILGIKLTKEAKDLYTANYKTLLKEFRDRNGKISYVHGLEDFIV